MLVGSCRHWPGCLCVSRFDVRFPKFQLCKSGAIVAMGFHIRRIRDAGLRRFAVRILIDTNNKCDRLNWLFCVSVGCLGLERISLKVD